ncbi:MAG: ribulose-phosphate 3-epimerase [Nitrososphaerota archaeon]
MKNQVKVAPSIISADMLNLSDEVRLLEEAGADMIHIDTYPFIAFAFDYNELSRLVIGTLLLDFLRRRTSLPLDVHLSVETTREMVERYIDLGADIITFHPDVAFYPEEIIQSIKDRGVELGLATTISSDLSYIRKFSYHADVILVVTANINFSGMVRIDEAERRILDVQKIIGGRAEVAVDGGVDLKTAPHLVKAGATILVTGKYLFKSSDYKEAITRLKNVCKV